MRRGGVFFGALSISAIISAICIFSLSCQALAEEISITTYYPSPYGSYEELRSNKMVIGETDASKIEAPPSGGLTLAPQSQGAIGLLTGVPKGTLMYGTLTNDANEKSALHYWNGSEWEEMAVKKKDIFVGEAKLGTYSVSPSQGQFNTGGKWRTMQLNSDGVVSVTDSDGCQYAKAFYNKMMQVSGNNQGCKALQGGGFYKVSWAGMVGVNATNEQDELTLQLFGTRTGVGVFIIDQITLTDEEACDKLGKDIVTCSASMDNEYHYEPFDGETLVSVPPNRNLVVGIRAKTKGGDLGKIAGTIDDVKFQVDKAGIY